MRVHLLRALVSSSVNNLDQSSVVSRMHVAASISRLAPPSEACPDSIPHIAPMPPLLIILVQLAKEQPRGTQREVLPGIEPGLPEV